MKHIGENFKFIMLRFLLKYIIKWVFLIFFSVNYFILTYKHFKNYKSDGIYWMLMIVMIVRQQVSHLDHVVAS